MRSCKETPFSSFSRGSLLAAFILSTYLPTSSFLYYILPSDHRRKAIANSKPLIPGPFLKNGRLFPSVSLYRLRCDEIVPRRPRRAAGRALRGFRRRVHLVAPPTASLRSAPLPVKQLVNSKPLTPSVFSMPVGRALLRSLTALLTAVHPTKSVQLRLSESLRRCSHLHRVPSICLEMVAVLRQTQFYFHQPQR